MGELLSLRLSTRNNYILKIPRTLGELSFSCTLVRRISDKTENFSDPFLKVQECNSFFVSSQNNGFHHVTRSAYEPSHRSWFEINLGDPIICLQILTNYNKLPGTDAVAIQQVMNSLLHTTLEDIDKRADRVRWMMLELEEYYKSK